MTKLWWGLGVLLVAVAVFYCLVPTRQIPSAFDFSDKLNHVLGHAALAVYFTGLVPRRAWWKIFVFLLSLGIGIEFAQHYMHFGRHGDWRDVVANASGAMLGLLLGMAGLSRWTQWAARLIGPRAAP
jgi:VanZ family protein